MSEQQSSTALHEPTYLGDGVYAGRESDGTVWLAAGSHDSPKRIYLEPEVYAALTRYVERSNGR